MPSEVRTASVPPQASGKRLDSWLAERYPICSRQKWQKRIAAGEVLLNAQPTRPARRLQAGDQIAFTVLWREEPEVPQTLPVLYEDADYIAIDKPAGLPVHPSGIYRTQTVVNFLSLRGMVQTPHLLYRLDRETSGVLLVAKTRRAAVAFHRMPHKDLAEKDYYVAVEGEFPEFFDAKGWIYRLPQSRLRRQRFFCSDPTALPAAACAVRDCHTLFRRVSCHSGLSLLSARLVTGRMHQIRATLFSLGFPVVGDKLYGFDPQCYFRFADDTITEEDWRKLRLRRSALHCARISLHHPFTGKPWTIEAPLPQDIKSLFPAVATSSVSR
ncbi:MAG: RluA family pseudouridine synthase [Leptospiraceae bacterium]|nr:RluA family pseudouridine synthase [Leptospiraceae bacterium]